jgi:hypothetical protein
MDDLGCGCAILAFLGIIVLALGVFCFEGWLLMALWNWLLVGFGLAEISFIKGCGFVILLNLIGGFFRSTVHSKK